MENVILEVVKEKTNIRGFWKAESGKVFVDNIKPFKAENAFQYEFKIQELFDKGELAVFTIGRTKAFILFPDYMQTLKNKIELRQKTLKASFFKALLNQYGGFTVEKLSGEYLITIWKE